MGSTGSGGCVRVNSVCCIHCMYGTGFAIKNASLCPGSQKSESAPRCFCGIISSSGFRMSSLLMSPWGAKGA